MIAFQHYLTILIIALISFIVGSTIHRYSNADGIFSFYRVFITRIYEKTFRTNNLRAKYSFILKPLLECTECFCGWISIPFFVDRFVFYDPLVYFSHLILTIFLTIYITLKLY